MQFGAQKLSDLTAMLVDNPLEIDYLIDIFLVI